MEFPSDLSDYLKAGNQLNYDVSKAEAVESEFVI